MMTTKKKKKIQGLEEEEPNHHHGGGGVVGSTSSTSPPGPPDDRISELPKEILHHILGLLEMDEFLIGTSLVSTKWRNLWKSSSSLNFPNCTSCSRRDGIRNNVEKYLNFVDHVLFLRDSQASKIQLFRYYCDHFNLRRRLGDYDYFEILHNFIVSAVANQGAQEIQISTGGGRRRRRDDNSSRIIHFNPSIFTSGKLRKFTFQVLNAYYLIQFPRSMCHHATQLAHLSLRNIKLPEGDSNAELHFICPVLDKLVLDCCYSKHLKLLDISAPRLNSLSILNNRMRNEHFDALGGCRLEIHTPNLTSFRYSGCVFVDCFTENLPRITRAQLKISKETGMVVKTNSFAIKLLYVLTSAHFLVLAGFEVLSQDTLRDLLTPFTSLTRLILITSCNISSIHGMVHLLNNCNTLEVLSWIVDKFSTTVEGDDVHLMLPQCELSHLKHVHIQNLRGHENEIEFVKFLLRSSIVLEDLIIKTTKKSMEPTIEEIEENLKQFIEEETSFRSIKLQIL